MLPEINLLPKRERQGNVLYYVFLICVILCLLLYAFFAFIYFKTSNNLRLAEQQFDQLELEKTALETELSQKSDEQVDDVGESIRFAEQFIFPTSHFIDELLKSLPDYAYLSEYKFNFESVELQTQFETLIDVSSYTDILVESDFITDAMVKEIETKPTEQSDEETYSFDTIPRYDVSYSLVLDLQALKREADEDE